MARERAILQPGATRTSSLETRKRRVPLQICGDGFAQGGNAAGGDVAVAACGDGIAQGIDDWSGGMKIGLAKLEVDDRATFALEFFGAGEDGEGTFAGQLRNARCKWTHGVGGSVRKFITSRPAAE